MSDDIVIPRHHYYTLIQTANGLLAVSRNVTATILEDTPYESMLRGPGDALAAALDNVPGGSAGWDGVWRDSDVTYTPFRHHSQPDRSGPDAGVKAVHGPTGLSVESYMKPNAEENKRSALSGLKQRVERHRAAV